MPRHVLPAIAAAITAQRHPTADGLCRRRFLFLFNFRVLLLLFYYSSSIPPPENPSSFPLFYPSHALQSIYNACILLPANF